MIYQFSTKDSNFVKDLEMALENLDNEWKFFIGIQHINSKYKGFISRDCFDSFSYRARSFEFLTEGNGWLEPTKKLNELLQKLENINFKFYIFENRNEFLEWAKI